MNKRLQELHDLPLWKVYTPQEKTNLLLEVMIDLLSDVLEHLWHIRDNTRES